VGRHIVLVCVRALRGCRGGTHDGGVFVGDGSRGVVMLDDERGPVARRNMSTNDPVTDKSRANGLARVKGSVKARRTEKNVIIFQPNANENVLDQDM
jgi:hypothetical protein